MTASLDYAQQLGLSHANLGTAWTQPVPFILIGVYQVNFFTWGTFNGASVKLQISPFTQQPPAGTPWKFFDATAWTFTDAGVAEKHVFIERLGGVSLRVLISGMASGSVLNYALRLAKA